MSEAGTETATYRVFGLNIRFPRPVPTLTPARVADRTDPDVTVAFAAIPSGPIDETVNEDLAVSRHPDGLLIDVEEVGRFLVSEGRRILVDPDPRATTAQVDLYLTGSIMGAALHQRAILPLHCNAFACNGMAVLLCGDSGAGKSTLAAWLEARGHALLTDDVCALTFAPGGRAFGHPGMPRLRLWADALETAGRWAGRGTPVPWAEGKFELPMASRRGGDPLPVGAIYHLREAKSAGDFAIRTLHGLHAVDALTSNIYRRRIADILGRGSGYLAEAVHLASTIPICTFERTWGMEHFEMESAILARHAQALCANAYA